MANSSKNVFSIDGDTITISHSDGDFIATASLREDYEGEIQSVTWSKNGNYVYSQKLGVYLHIYIMKKWYGEDVYDQMKTSGYIVDHMDNNGYNCCIDNLCFLTYDENIAKGHTVDKKSKNKTHIALSLFKDFYTQNIQMTIVFNYPAIAKISSINSPAVIELVYLLYDCEYEIVLNDARAILYDYEYNHTFDPEKLHDSDYHIEGAYGIPWPIERYNRYIEGGHGHAVCFFVKKSPIKGWKVEEQRKFFYLRGTPKPKE